MEKYIIIAGYSKAPYLFEGELTNKLLHGNPSFEIIRLSDGYRYSQTYKEWKQVSEFVENDWIYE